ncbi:MAG: SPASM domain-containing protein [Candidatus Omnitrophica bacterium]|nr:SPASM domain-containing protein [Candidatus Omnitrophota bacterium]
MESPKTKVKTLSGLANVNVELTSRCNKDCWICGRRERDRIYKDLQYGDMAFEIVESIARQLEPGIIVQLHNNGEPLLYPRFKEAVSLFKKRGIVTNIVTNGKLIVEKANEIIGYLDTMSISIIENDPKADNQLNIIKNFLEKKGRRKPFTSLRFVGRVNEEKYKDIGVLKIRRILHSPKGSFDYQRKNPTIPEIGICLDFLHHLAIDRRGDVSVCVRFDPERELVLGNIKKDKLADLWNSEKRRRLLELHISGKREDIPFCNKCHFWGVPTGE